MSVFIAIINNLITSLIIEGNLKPLFQGNSNHFIVVTSLVTEFALDQDRIQYLKVLMYALVA